MSKIKNYLRMQSSPCSVTEIYEALSKRMGLDISRKTIERDMYEMEERSCVVLFPGTPAKYALCRPLEVELCLKVEEVRAILSVLGVGSELYVKLNKYLET